MIAARDDNHAFGEIGWQKGFLTLGSTKVVIVHKTPGGKAVSTVLDRLSAPSTHTYKVVNDETCDGQPAPKDNSWDFCVDGKKVRSLNLGFSVAQRFASGGEVGSGPLRSGAVHNIPMGTSTITNNTYKSTAGTWMPTSSAVYCIDAHPHNPPSSGVCRSDNSSRYSVSGVVTPYTSWTVTSDHGTRQAGASGSQDVINSIEEHVSNRAFAQLVSSIATYYGFQTISTTSSEQSLSAHSATHGVVLGESDQQDRNVIVFTLSGNGTDQWGDKYTTFQVAVDKKTAEILMLATY